MRYVLIALLVLTLTNCNDYEDDNYYPEDVFCNPDTLTLMKSSVSGSKCFYTDLHISCK